MRPAGLPLLPLFLYLASNLPFSSALSPLSPPNQHHLFSRQDSGGALPEPGTAEWKSMYPDPFKIPHAVPKTWMDRYFAAKAAGLIPPIPVATMDASGFPRYPDDDKTFRDPKTCSHTHSACSDSDDIVDVRDGYYGLSFDDGPRQESRELYTFLKNNSVRATHYMIGQNILANPDVFKIAFEELEGEIAVHTWSHRFAITLTDEEYVAEIGWCMQIIYDLTGGRVPASIRPPNGDGDRRTKAIAKHVFGLKLIYWDHDTEDWCLNVPALGTACGSRVPNDAYVAKSYEKYIGLPKSPGLLVLAHEHVPRGIEVFKKAYPKMIEAGWKVVPVYEAVGFSPWQNADSNTSPPTSLAIAPDTSLSPFTATGSPENTVPAPAPSRTSSAAEPAEATEQVKVTEGESEDGGILGLFGSTRAHASSSSELINSARRKWDGTAGKVRWVGAAVGVGVGVQMAFGL